MTNPKEAKSILSVVANEEHYFKLVSEESIKSLEELQSNLENMPEGIFHHHVTLDRNDFANWVKDIIRDKELSSTLLILKNKEDMFNAVKERREDLKDIIIEETYKIAEQIDKIVKKHEDKHRKKTKHHNKIEHKPHPKIKHKIHNHKIQHHTIKHKEHNPPPKRHEYLRGHHEHVNYNLKEFLYGAIFGASLMIILLRIFAMI